MTLYYRDQNECDFSITFADESKANQVQEAINAGIDAWYMAAHEEVEDTEYFTAEEIRSFYEAGYTEPTIELLDRWGIKYEVEHGKGE